MKGEIIPRRPGGPIKRPKPNAAKRIGELAAKGHRWASIAPALGVDHKTLRKWREEFPELQDAFDQGHERERHTLHSKLAEAAAGGNITAGIFLLKAAHGYREGDQSDQGGRVNVTIALPGSMTLAQYNSIRKKEPEND